MEELEAMLQRHDWYYQYSDDHSVYKEGDAKSNQIYAKMKELGNTSEVKALFDKYNPHNKKT